MDTKALRQKVLDLAIRGKLVPQNPDDEPPSVLLERIRAEKRQMVKDGKLKAKDIKNDTIIFRGEDNLHYEKFADGTVKCIEDEIPFEVPEGWEWCRLNDLFSVCSAKRVLQSEWRAEGIPFYRAREIAKLAENDIVANELFISEEHYKNIIDNHRIPQENDLMVSAVGTIGKVYVVKPQERFYYKDASVICFQNINNIIDSKFAKIMLESQFLQQQMANNSKGTTVDTITISAAQTYLCVLPPLNEQINIVFTVEKILALVKKINVSKDELKHLISESKSKILDLAIRGKLVPQDPNDEPASVLLERIRVEKEELIKQGKIKRDKKESVIFKDEDNSYYEQNDSKMRCIDEEIPFKLPNTWNWCRLKSICKKIIDGSHNPPKGSELKTQYIMASSRNIVNNMISDLGNARYLNKTDFVKENSRTNVSINDIFLTTVATLGRSCIYDGIPKNLCFQRSVTIISTYISPKYLKIFFDAPHFQDVIKNNAMGTAQKGFYLNQLEVTLVCVPPKTEQERIVNRIHQLLLHIQNVEKNLN